MRTFLWLLAAASVGLVVACFAVRAMTSPVGSARPGGGGFSVPVTASSVRPAAGQPLSWDSARARAAVRLVTPSRR
jgi:hypothetical protein